jgi:hypothetical protein
MSLFCLLCVLQAVADRLGLQRQPLGGSGGRSHHGGDAAPLEVLRLTLYVSAVLLSVVPACRQLLTAWACSGSP